MKKIASVLALLWLNVLVAACSHPLKIVGEGDILSATGDRDCLLEDFQAGLDNCKKNYVIGAYNETYYGVPRPGWSFHRWARYCEDATNNECTFTVSGSTVASGYGITVPGLWAIYRPLVNTGFDSLFMGHSRFVPAAQGMPAHVGPTGQAGFPDHAQTTFSNAGVFGSPLGFWNDVNYRNAIQAILNTGNIDLFGMTYHYDAPDIQAYRDWVSYARLKNPDTRFFIGMPQPWYPEDNNSLDYEAKWESEHVVAHTIIDTLRAEFPHSDFYCIPYGQSAVELHKLHSAGNLPDVQYLVDPQPGSSVFLDNRYAHANQILNDLSELVWLKAIYGVDLSTYNDGNSYTTDLKAIATDIFDSHDPNYNAPL